MKYELNKKPNGVTWLTEQDQLKLNSNCPNSEKQRGEHPCGGMNDSKREYEQTHERSGFKHSKFDNSDERIKEISDNVNEAFDIDVKSATVPELRNQKTKISEEVKSLQKKIKDLTYSKNGIDASREEKIFISSVKIERLNQIEDKIELFLLPSNRPTK